MENTDRVVFHLKKFWEEKDLWEEIKTGRKTSEWRDFSKYWLKRLCIKRSNLFFVNETEPLDLTRDLKVHRAWFVVGYPLLNLPRLEVDITGLVYHPRTSQLEVRFANIHERRS